MKQLTWPVVGLIAVIGGVIVALAVLTEWDSAAIIAVVSILGGIGGGAAVAGGVSGRVEQLQAETTAQSTQLTTIERRVNGELDERMANIVRRVMREEGGR